MDYEKAYRAVLQTATNWIKDGCTDKEKICLKCIFPELRESEDERIRTFLYHTFTAQYLCKDKTGKWHGEPVTNILAYLEKQKENPKTADSIPSDCASDAKCEDRWHKVGDSLPDNGRLVLANDCLGNILLARYDGEGNWEVSVYDNDDYYCRNTITKWCDIPSEKQKEQKSAEWSYEDEKMIDDIIRALTKMAESEDNILPEILPSVARKYVKRLKSLRPSWKPSEEQMNALERTIRLANFGAEVDRRKALESLYEQLKSIQQEQPNDVRAEIKEYYGEDLAFEDERTKAAYHFFSAGKAFELREYEEEREKHITELLDNFQKGMNAGYEKAISELKEGKVECSPVMKEFIDKFFGIGNTFNFGFGPKNIQQEQPEADLEKASRNVYESWMGGAMNDVRRDMVELGKVLNARKEETK